MRTPVSHMRGFWGLMRAYWISERWTEAWFLTLLVAALTAAVSKSGVWLAVASGDFINAIASFHVVGVEAPYDQLAESVVALVALAALKTFAFIGLRHYFLTTLHRTWRRWLDDRFNRALLGTGRSYFHLLNSGGDGKPPVPDNIDQRVQEAIKNMAGGALGLAMGLFAVVTSVYFVGERLLQTSTSVEALAFLGRYGTLVLAFAVVVAYVPLSTWIALLIGRVMERLSVAMQRHEGDYRSELITLGRGSLQVAASRGEAVQERLHERLYKSIDATWIRQNRAGAVFMSFNTFHGFLAQKVVSYLPVLPAYLSGGVGLRGYVTGSELVGELINNCSWLIQVMPDIASLKANVHRVTELAEAIERVQDHQAFYRETGVSDFSYAPQMAVLGVTIQKLQLMHRGREAEPFLETGRLQFLPGQWIFVKGRSGCGKSSMLKAMNGLWAHGRGNVLFPAAGKRLYACQEIKLPPTSLKQLLTLPEAEADHDDLLVAAAMSDAGLGEFIQYLGDSTCHGRRWEDVLSGGQKQKLVLVRILLQRPDVLFLDEATTALDPQARVNFYQLVKERCPNAIVISVTHEPSPPVALDGRPFYDTILEIEDGWAVQRPILKLVGTPAPPARAWATASAGE